MVGDAEESLASFRRGHAQYSVFSNANLHWLYVAPITYAIAGFYRESLGNPILTWIAFFVLLVPLGLGIRQTYRVLWSVEEQLLLRDVRIEELQREANKLRKKNKKLKKGPCTSDELEGA
jgi:hypothetical protein